MLFIGPLFYSFIFVTYESCPSQLCVVGVVYNSLTVK